MEESKTYLAITGTINKENMAEVPNYLGQVMQIFSANGGIPVGRYKTIEPLLEDESPDMMAMIEFPGADVIKEMVAGEEFTSLADLRAKVFSKLNMTIVGNM